MRRVWGVISQAGEEFELLKPVRQQGMSCPIGIYLEGAWRWWRGQKEGGQVVDLGPAEEWWGLSLSAALRAKGPRGSAYPPSHRRLKHRLTTSAWESAACMQGPTFNFTVMTSLETSYYDDCQSVQLFRLEEQLSLSIAGGVDRKYYRTGGTGPERPFRSCEWYLFSELENFATWWESKFYN